MSVIADETWSWRELPVLAAIVRALDSGDYEPPGPGIAAIAALAGLDVDVTTRSLRALEEARLVEVTWANPARREGGFVRRASAQARQEVGAWPTPERLLDQLIELLRDAAENEADNERKTMYRRLADELSGGLRTVMLGLFTRFLGDAAS